VKEVIIFTGDPMRHVVALAQHIGPRPSTGEGEAVAARYLAEEMRTWADNVRNEPFSAFTSFSWPWMLIYGAGLLAAALLWWWPPAALLLAVLAAWTYWQQAAGRIELGYAFPKRVSQNIIGLIRPSLARRRRLLLVAHFDSARSSLLWSPGQVRYFRGTFLLSALATGLVLLATLLSNLGYVAAPLHWAWWPGPVVWAIVAAPGGLDLLIALLVLIHREAFCQVTPGANDNASGVAAALAACEQLAAQRLEHTEVWCVGTGCEEVGMLGMRALLKAHRVDLSDAAIIVLDNLGKGQMKYTLGEGLLSVLPCDPRLVELAGGVARRHPQWNLGTSVNRLLPTDMGPALLEGYPAIGLRAEDERGLLPNWHWQTDTVDNVEPANVGVAASFVVAMARALDAQA